MIKIKNLSVSYGHQTVIHSLTHEFPAEKVTALVGLSGCGKTTLLNTLAGLTVNFQGEVFISDSQITPQKLDFLHEKIGYVVQGGGLFPHLTVKQNIALRDMGVRQISEDRLKELLEITKISEQWLSRYPKEISGGQQQRVGIARALYHNPEFLLLDEPLGALDPILRKDLQQSLLDLFKQLKKTVILVTHDLNEAEFLGDAIAVMNKGRIEQVGTGEQLRRSPQTDFVKKFVEVF